MHLSEALETWATHCVLDLISAGDMYQWKVVATGRRSMVAFPSRQALEVEDACD